MSIGSFVKKVITFGHSGVVKVSQIFISLFGENGAAQFAHAALQLLEKSEFGRTVEKYVLDLNNQTALTNDIKKSQAVSFAKDYLGKHGLTVGDSLINMTVELAVSKAKGYFESTIHDHAGVIQGQDDPAPPESNTTSSVPPTAAALAKVPDSV